jgi:hypothetical protein
MQDRLILINYANAVFRKSQIKNSRTGSEIGGFMEVISYTPKDVDQQFRAKNSAILRQEKGGGYFLWKPYFIRKTLDLMNDGDFLFYCDSGSYFIDSIADLVEFCKSKNQDIIPFELEHAEKHWSKRDAFVLMDCDSEKYFNTKQRLASFTLIRKSDYSLRFVEDWLRFAEDHRILTDEDNQCGLDNYDGFIENRYDQTVFSLLTKKLEIPAYRDPSQFGTALKELYPESNYKQFLIHTRKRNYPFYVKLRKYLRRKFASIKQLLYLD